MIDYSAADKILDVFGIAAFVGFAVSIVALPLSVAEGGQFLTLSTLQIAILTTGFAILMYVVSKLRVKLWIEEIIES